MTKTLKKTDQEEVAIIAKAMLDKKALHVCALDLKKLETGICDYFVICNADSCTQVGAIADFVEERMLIEAHHRVRRSQGKENNIWIILDYTDIVVHIFQTPYRNFYRLEALWADAVITDYKN